MGKRNFGKPKYRYPRRHATGFGRKEPKPVAMPQAAKVEETKVWAIRDMVLALPEMDYRPEMVEVHNRDLAALRRGKCGVPRTLHAHIYGETCEVCGKYIHFPRLMRTNRR
jgi:hypothetical protein